MVVNNDGGGIFSQLEQAAFAGPFERIFGTPHGTDLERLAGASGVPYARITAPGELAGALAGTGCGWLRSGRTGRLGAALRAELEPGRRRGRHEGRGQRSADPDAGVQHRVDQVDDDVGDDHEQRRRRGRSR